MRVDKGLGRCQQQLLVMQVQAVRNQLLTPQKLKAPAPEAGCPTQSLRAARTHQLGPNRLGRHAGVHGQHKAAAVGVGLQGAKGAGEA